MKIPVYVLRDHRQEEGGSSSVSGLSYASARPNPLLLLPLLLRRHIASHWPKCLHASVPNAAQALNTMNTMGVVACVRACMREASGPALLVLLLGRGEHMHKSRKSGHQKCMHKSGN